MSRSDCRQCDKEFLDNLGLGQILISLCCGDAGTGRQALKVWNWGESHTIVVFKPSLTSVMADQKSIRSEQGLVLPDKNKVKAAAQSNLSSGVFKGETHCSVFPFFHLKLFLVLWSYSEFYSSSFGQGSLS